MIWPWPTCLPTAGTCCFRAIRSIIWIGICEFTEWSLLVDVSRWSHGRQRQRRAQLGERWQRLLRREIPWKMVVQRTRVFEDGDSEQASIFSDARFVEQKLREQLPADLRDLPLRVDIARHIERPHTRGPSGGQNFLFDSARGQSAAAGHA